MMKFIDVYPRYDRLKQAIEERRSACLTALDQQKFDQEREMRSAQVVLSSNSAQVCSTFV